VERLAILEGALFIAGEEGVDYESLQRILGIDNVALNEVIEEYKKELDNIHRGLSLVKLGNRYKLVTKAKHHEYYQRIVNSNNDFNFSNASLETLAIIAYNQPVTRIEVEKIRGVNSDSIIRRLMAYSLIKEAGRKDSVGRPMMYEVTNEFLDVFNLTSLEELPSLDIEEDEDEVQDIFSTRFVEEDNNG
jgi:segregation and condensation protein B